MKKAAFLDRDGVINRKAPEGQYVTKWEQIQFLPGAFEAIRLLNDAGFLVVVVSNQRCVAKGLITTNELDVLHARMRREFTDTGATIDAIYYCPHENDPPCGCRKPRPGLLFDAARIHEVDLFTSWMIGDSGCDVEAGRNAGCHTARLMSDGEPENSVADVVASSLLDAVRKILLVEAALPRAVTVDCGGDD